MGRKLAAFWKHADRMGNRFKCKFCKQVFPGGVVRLRAHLSGITGQGIQVCSKVPEDVKSAALLASNDGPIKKKSKVKTSSSNSDITSPQICDTRCSNEVDSSLAKFVEMNDISCSIVESPSFINLVNVLIKSGSGYVLPSCSALENQLILSLRKEVEKYVSIARQSWEEIGCSLIFDIWRSEKEKRSFISIIACSGKRAVLLNTFEIPDNNLTASFLEKVVHHVVEYVGPDKVIQYFVDDTQCSEEIAKLLTSKCPHVLTTRCVVRELESFFEEVHQEVEWIRATFETAKCLVDAMYKDSDLLSLMRKYTGGKELKQSPGYDMLESIFEVKEDLVKFAQSPEWLASGYYQQENGKKSTAIITSEEFWKQGEEVLMALKPLFTILHLDDTSDSSFGYLYGLVKVAEEVIAHLQTNKQEKYQKLWSIFELKKNRIIHETHKAAAFLNPAYLCYYSTGQDITQIEEGINYIIQKFVAIADREAFVEQAMHYRRTFSDPSELFKTIAAKTSPPCEWWNEFGKKVPILKKLATKILCQPCGSSSYRSGLGAFRANLVKQRRLVPELNDLNVRMNLFLMEKCNADNEEKKKKKRINFEEFGQQKSTNWSSDAGSVEPRHCYEETRLSTREELPRPKPSKLCFMTVIASPILTGQKVEGYQRRPIHVYLVDSATDCVVQDGTQSTLTLTISVLDGDFTNEAPSDECRTREYFDSNDLSSDMMPLVTGDLQLTLVQGMGMLGEFSFNYNSRGTRSGKFRLAVKTYTGDCEGIRVLEGISNAFVVEDNEVTSTQHPAALEMQLPKDSASLGVISPIDDGWWGGLLGESSSSPGDWNGSIWNYNQLQRSCRSLTQTAARRVKKKALLWRSRSCNRRLTMERRSPMLLNKEKIGNEVEVGEVTLPKNVNEKEDCEEINAEPLAVDSSGTELEPREETYEVLSPKHQSTALELSLTRDEALEPKEGADSIISRSGDNANRQKVEGTVVLIKKNVLDFNDFNATLLDGVHELLGKHVSLQLVSSAMAEYPTGASGHGLSQIEPKGKLGEPATLEWTDTETTLTAGESAYKVAFDWDNTIGHPEAFVIKNDHHSEFYLKTVTLNDVPGHGRVHFVCNSWVYPTKNYEKDRVFFANKAYLPHQTPSVLVKYRNEELVTLRGDGTGELQEWDRVYDYAYYNDLGKPDKGPSYARPTLGGSRDYPYPRRGRTGRAPTKADPEAESSLPILDSLNIYVPRDERFGHLKMSDFLEYVLKSIGQFFEPALESQFDNTLGSEFESFDDVLRIYNGGIKAPGFVDKLAENIPLEIIKVFLKSDGDELEGVLKYPMPSVIKENTSAWRTDEEFGREMLAGTNPVSISRLKEFPPTSNLNPVVYGNQNSSITEDHIKDGLNGLTIEEAIHNNRLFILDHHDVLMLYLRRINDNTSTKTYATRTILFLQEDGTLKPLAIELSLPSNEGDMSGCSSEVYTPSNEGVEGSIWELAKAYVAVNDSGYHQLISHWLNTHAIIEPFVIATNRQLSVLHPIYKLLHPHFRDTMNINAFARQILINAGGILEKTVFPGKYAMEMSSIVYKSWVFPDQALPTELIKRGMAVEDNESPHGVRLIIEDYPYAVDGLEIWTAIKTWVEDYCSFYYPNDELVQTDVELQSWWTELVEEGHGDKKHEPWWPKMQTLKELTDTITIIIWVASALHAAVNFGQYAYAGYLPNRPSLSRRFMPKIGTPEYDEVASNPERAFLKTFTADIQTILGISLIELLSQHPSDAVYLGHRDSPEWTKDYAPLDAFDKFGEKLKKIEEKIVSMNNDKRLKNRTGPVGVPYTLLYPTGEPGLSGKGIPNSVSL